MIEAEQVGDHRERQRHGELGVQVCVAFGRECVDKLVGERVDAGFKAREDARREHFDDQAAEALMLRWVAAGETDGVREALLADRVDLRIIGGDE
jgi:hypothetical protein